MARSRYRSVTYDLEASLAVARVVAAAGGDVDPAAIAGALGYSGVNNGAFLSRMASARLFGLVAGRSDRVLLSERGQAILSGVGPAASRARIEAFRAVPLFRAVLDVSAGGPLPEARALAGRLVDEFGETPTKAATVAAKLIDSAGQAGLLQPVGMGTSQFMTVPPDLTDARPPPSNLFVPPVRLGQQPRQRARFSPAGRRGVPAVDDRTVRAGQTADDETDLWLDDGDGLHGRRHPGRLRRTGVVAAAVACLAVVGVPVGLVLTSGGGPGVAGPAHLAHHTSGHLGGGPAEHQVLSALSATTDSGSFDFTYDLSATGSTAGAKPGPRAGGHGSVVSGQGTLDTDPLAMVATTSLGVNVTVDGTQYWEGEGRTGAGSPLPNFAGLVEGTLGTRPGAVAMMAMASPTGFLDLDQTEVTGADQTGTGTAGGTPVTEYQVSLDATQVAQSPGTTSEEAATIGAAVKVLQQQGLTGITAELSVDAGGYIREAKSVATFADGGTVTLQTTLSDFGCAGTVLTPGEAGTATPPAGCVSPDTGVVPTTTTTPTTTATSPPPSTPLPSVSVPPDIPAPPSTTTTVPSNDSTGSASSITANL